MYRFLRWILTFGRWMSQALPPVTTRTQSQSLLRMITMAMEHRLQLAPLLHEFARDERGIQQSRVRRLAELLDDGTSLPDALEQIPRVLPEDDVLAIRIGAQSGSLPMTLQRLVRDTGRAEYMRLKSQLKSIVIYPVVVTLMITAIATFLFMKIWPVFMRMMDDMGIKTAPSVFQSLASFAQLLGPYGGWLVVGLILVLIWILWSDRSGRIVRRAILRPWFDMRSVDLLQSLSVVAEAGRPIVGAISTLARYHHDPTLRRKLLFVRNEVEHGADLWSALQDVKLLTAAEVALMEISAKVGNRAWAMSQLAASKRRRIQRRIQILAQTAEPAAILLLGAAVFTMCLGVFGPLLNMVFHWV